ncbi:MAG: hypothetical protein ACRBB3_09575 [Alphaproteobacteria bacterium]
MRSTAKRFIRNKKPSHIEDVLFIKARRKLASAAIFSTADVLMD